MINLLPVEEKQRIRRLYRSRVIIVSLAALSALFVTGALGLVPSYLSALARYESAVLSSGGTEQKSAGEEEPALLKETKEINRKADLLIKGASDHLPGTLLREVIAKKPPGILFADFSYASPQTGKDGKGKPAEITASGVADTRDTLLSFVNTLNAREVFSSVDLPISNFVKDRDLPFTLRMEVKQKTP